MYTYPYPMVNNHNASFKYSYQRASYRRIEKVPIWILSKVITDSIVPNCNGLLAIQAGVLFLNGNDTGKPVMDLWREFHHVQWKFMQSTGRRKKRKPCSIGTQPLKGCSWSCQLQLNYHTWTGVTQKIWMPNFCTRIITKRLTHHSRGIPASSRAK